ncbi:MAG: Uncharacterised protein [Glaciecola sp. HTCC2999]|nr:MAG: Uncharacterised protein [Glaciecola sp. HTCC2999]
MDKLRSYIDVLQNTTVSFLTKIYIFSITIIIIHTKGGEDVTLKSNYLLKVGYVYYSKINLIY